MKNTIIVILSLLVIGLSSYIIFDKVINKNDNKQEQQKLDNSSETENTLEQNSTQQNSEKQATSDNSNVSLKNYNLDEIKNIVITISTEENGDPAVKKYTVEDKDEIKTILLALDDAQSIGAAPDGIGLQGLTSLDINRYQDPTTSVVFLQNGNVLIGTLGVGESRYGEYKISNTNIKSYIEKKYFN